MSEPIKAGDLVMLVRADCEHEAKNLGRIFVVPALRHDISHCPKCGHQYGAQWHAVSDKDPGHGWPLRNLKRIDPLPENEDIRHDEEMTA